MSKVTGNDTENDSSDIESVLSCNNPSKFPAGIYMFKVNNRNTRTRYEICSKLKYFTPCSSVSIVKFE